MESIEVNMYKAYENKFLLALIEKYPALECCKLDISKAFETIVRCYENGGKLLLAGNGGSAADAEHIVGELMKSFIKKRHPNAEFIMALKNLSGENDWPEKLQTALPAVALSANSLITAVINDVEGEMVFAQQVMGLGEEGDVFIGISTSGNSRNVALAGYTAKAKGLNVIALTGEQGGKMNEIADTVIKVPAKETYEVQELHLPVYHALCLMIEDYFFAV